ncbi:MAG: hypothetical protein ACK4IY_03810, partial [Chitinophagales bacterium]
METTTYADARRATIWQAFIPIIVLVGLLVLNVIFYKDSASSGPNQIALILAGVVAAVIGLNLKVPLK